MDILSTLQRIPKYGSGSSDDDTNPDVGSASTSYIVPEDDIRQGFSVSMELDVTENGGRNSGQSAHFVVTYTFTPMLSANK